MSVIGLILILAALAGCVYFGITLYQDVKKKVQDKRAGKK